MTIQGLDNAFRGGIHATSAVPAVVYWAAPVTVWAYMRRLSDGMMEYITTEMTG